MVWLGRPRAVRQDLLKPNFDQVAMDSFVGLVFVTTSLILTED